MQKHDKEQPQVTELSRAEMTELAGGFTIGDTGEPGDLYRWFIGKIGLPDTQSPDPLTTDPQPIY